MCRCLCLCLNASVFPGPVSVEQNVQKTEMHQVQTNIEKLQQLQVKQLKAEKLLKKSLVVDDLTLLVNLKAQVRARPPDSPLRLLL